MTGRAEYECECCGLWLCRIKSKGIGYYCDECLDHQCWQQECGRPGAQFATVDALDETINADHERLARENPVAVGPEKHPGPVNCTTDDPLWNVSHLVVANLIEGDLAICGAVLHARDHPSKHVGCACVQPWPRCTACMTAKEVANSGGR